MGDASELGCWGEGYVAWRKRKDKGFSADAERCLTSSLSSSPIGLSLPAPPAPGIPYAFCFFFSGLPIDIVVSFVLCVVVVVCVECEERWN